jgi:hypothetical protein
MSRRGRPRHLLYRAGAFALLVAVVLAGPLMLATAGPAAAAPPALRLTLAARTVAGGRPTIEMLARLAAPGDPTATDRAIKGVTITFAVHLDEFTGAPLLTLGSATTNAAGDARLTYSPTFGGRQPLVATATDSSGNTLATATTSYRATAAVHPFAGSTEAIRPDGAIGRVVVGVLLGIVALLWIVLITVVVRVQRSREATPL